MKPLLVILLLSLSAVAQVSVPQSYIDASDKAFQEVVADRAAMQAQKVAIDAQADALKDAHILIDALANQNKLKDAQIADLAKLKCDKTTIFFVVKITRCR